VLVIQPDRLHDGVRYGGPSSRGDTAYCRSEHHGRFSAGVGDCGGGAGRGDHDGSTGRASRGDWAQGGCRTGGNLLGNFALLRAGRAVGREHGEERGRRACVLSIAASADAGVSERYFADHGGGDRAPRNSGARAPLLPGSGASLSRRRQAHRHKPRRICLLLLPLSLSRKKAATGAITGAPGK
jgi:hypothetical protein